MAAGLTTGLAPAQGHATAGCLHHDLAGPLAQRGDHAVVQPGYRLVNSAERMSMKI